MIINYEKFRNPRAAEMYYKYVVNEPADYYERLMYNSNKVHSMIINFAL